ncbi:hypothetical protein B0H63DRAFT_75701 [Podospora didyma]|uniref:Zn(2)-C6 fungal-type domain-containing protein n=1 Tax=Podospora didyma TaxID=330526 RepID=A0AAE0K1K7_9PEZI|nr:hypothetical protein B0H63DRAFT_75701 [Podospora didyma]
MMPRQFHRKSRFGCTECKKLRIKCDEIEPICGRCLRTRSNCYYPRQAARNTNASDETGPPWTAARHLSAPPQPPSSFDLLDMTLMHHYATDTCKHLFMGSWQVQLWQYDIPALAASHVVLLHGILAVTAIHYAGRENATPAQRDLCATRSLHHHSLSLPRFQAMVASASAETAPVIVAYAVLLGLWVYAFPQVAADENDDEHQSLGDILTMIQAMRGARAVLNLYRDAITQSPMRVFVTNPPPSPFLLSPEKFEDDDRVSRVRQALYYLRDQVLHHESDKDAAQQLQIYLDRYVAKGPGHNNRLAAAWIARVGDDYWARLRGGQPHAVLVFAYSALLVRASEHECWWMSGWSERIMRACRREVMSSSLERHGIATAAAAAAAIDWVWHEHQIRAGADGLVDVVRSMQAGGASSG